MNLREKRDLQERTSSDSFTLELEKTGKSALRRVQVDFNKSALSIVLQQPGSKD